MKNTIKIDGNDYRVCPANEYKGSLDCSPVLFATISDASGYVAEFFADFDKPYGIFSRVIGYVLNEYGDNIGYIEEHYVDAGSVDYAYTAIIH